MAALAARVDEDLDFSLPPIPPPALVLVVAPQRQRSRRPQGRIVRPRKTCKVEHDCGIFHTKLALATYAAVHSICPKHDTVRVDVGEYGRKYPEPICYECLPPHTPLCPMGNPSVLASWAMGLTCICPNRLTPLGLAIQKLPTGAAGRSKSRYGVGPIHVEDEDAAHRQ